MDEPITYCLLIKKYYSGAVRIGRLGVFEFPNGYYVYTGSARRGMEARIKRHLAREKRLHWHIDYLLQKSMIKEVYLFGRGECEVSKNVFSIPGATLLAKKFGSRDCSCPSHLAYFGSENPPRLDSLLQGAIKKLFK